MRNEHLKKFCRLCMIVGLWLIPFMLAVHFKKAEHQFIFILIVLLIGVIFSLLVMLKGWYKKCLIAEISMIFAMQICMITISGIHKNNLVSLAYKEAQCGTEFFDNKNMMAIVSHQDDDLNLVGGMLEQYVKRNSNVSVVFCNSGDYYGIAETRMHEALSVMRELGIGEENVYFLGFGNLYNSILFDEGQIGHIYNSPDDTKVWTAHSGATQTFGLKDKPSYTDVAYTRGEYIKTLQCVLKDVKPDVLYVTDFDNHADHRGDSLFFEEALGDLLKDDENYNPIVFKGFCYRTAWTAMDDFADNINIISTLKPSNMINEVEIPYFIWNERIRIPVMANGLNRFLSQTQSFKLLSMYSSQGAGNYAGKVTNGDKVFWERRTDSVLYNADIYIGNSRTQLLNDFKLLDSSDVTKPVLDMGVQNIDGVITVNLNGIESVEAIALYDNPDIYTNILSGQIELDNGTKIEFGELNKMGCATYIDIPRSEVKSFTVTITDFAGENAGLMEIEAYERKDNYNKDNQYIMLVDDDDNFVYDYLVEDEIELKLYAYPYDISFNDVEIELSGDEECYYEIINNKIKLHCPDGKECKLTVSKDNVYTTAYFNNPSYIKKAAVSLWQKIDADSMTNPHTVFTIDGQRNYYSKLIISLKVLIYDLVMN